MNEAFVDNSVGSNPMFDQIEQCEFLKRYCQKQSKSVVEGEIIPEEKQVEEKKKSNNDIDKALQKGSIQLAETKDERDISVFSSLVSKKRQTAGKQSKKGGQELNNDNSSVDFQVIKKFNNLKLSVPMKEEEFLKTIEELDQLRDALVYWGKII